MWQSIAILINAKSYNTLTQYLSNICSQKKIKTTKNKTQNK